MRIGIIGCGAVTQGKHLPSLSCFSDVTLSWLSDLDSKNCKRLAKIYKSQFIPVNVPIKDRPKIDLLVIATPYGARKDIYYQLKNIQYQDRPALYIEKPIARSLNELQNIISDYKDWQVIVGLQRRALSNVQCAKSLVQSSIFGELEDVSITLGTLGRIITEGGYRGNANLGGGGILMEMGIHYIDSTLFAIEASKAEYLEGRMKLFEGFDIHTKMKFGITLKDSTRIPLKILISSIETKMYDSHCGFIELNFTNASVTFDILGESILKVRPIKKSFKVFEIMAGQEYGPIEEYSLSTHFWKIALESIKTKTNSYANANQTFLTTKIIEEAFSHAE